ncbi:acyltransferase [Geomonas azotofigens]|uniref:acyltransferase n=1 Tax=Geomonas azotofigens TaxID=2843196 RepID=UPI001C10A525|nr:acyltransferase [Geomonas azotofigens]MBU5613367.1 N-acetyltransferase [Geomonas azotofigens]
MHQPIIRKAGIRDVEFGENVTVVEPVNMYECRVGSGSFIGPFVEIQKGAVIGERCRVQSHAFVCELVTVGDDCFISHGAMFINDTFSGGGPAGGRKELWRSTRLGSHVSIGTNATILPVTICDNVVIGAGAVVTKDIAEPGIYAGNPARKIKGI